MENRICLCLLGTADLQVQVESLPERKRTSTKGNKNDLLMLNVWDEIDSLERGQG